MLLFILFARGFLVGLLPQYSNGIGVGNVLGGIVAGLTSPTLQTDYVNIRKLVPMKASR